MSDYASIPCFCGISYYFLDETFVVSWHMEKYLTFCRAAKLPLMSSAPKSKVPLPVHEVVSSEKESAKSKAPFPAHKVVSSEKESVDCRKGLCKYITGSSVVYLIHCLIYFVGQVCVEGIFTIFFAYV